MLKQEARAMSSLLYGFCLLQSLLSLTTALPQSQLAQNNIGSTLPRRPYSLPNNDPNSAARAVAQQVRKAGYQFAPAVAAGPWSAGGSLGLAANKADTGITLGELAVQVQIANQDTLKASASNIKYNNLTTLNDYTKLYDNNWLLASPRGEGPAAGMLTNYTQDLLFSMERLSLNPYSLRRLRPSEDLPFEVEDAIARDRAGQTVEELQAAGRLFYADHRNQSTLPRLSHYSAACDALFYISPTNGDFLPLAIRTNVGNNLIYTPADAPNDWLLAKMMFNQNDLFMGQFDHFARSHFVIEAVGLSALRTLSTNHPLLGLINRFAYGAFSFRLLALAVLLSPGAAIDRWFGLSGEAAGIFSNTTYFNGYAGAVQANYFYTNLERRGLLGSKHGPELKHMPFLEDAGPIYDAIRAFTGAYCESYYGSDPSAISNDVELQAWLVDAVDAQVIDFPTKSTLRTVDDLADLMAYLGHIVSIAHHTVNLNVIFTGSGVLPFHPAALYKPVPESKGITQTDIVSRLPPLGEALGAIDLYAKFCRSELVDSDRTLVHMFDSEELLERSNPTVRQANEAFKKAMYARSEVIRQRTFGPDGLSQGMPFVWNALDPDVITWSVTA